MGCRLSRDDAISSDHPQGNPTEMSRENETKNDYKARFERKMCLAKETPEPVFDLSNCNLKEVPSGVFVLCRVLRKEILNLSKNKLTSFEGGELSELGLLKIVNISFNRIKKLPEEIFRLENLRELNISNNNINKLPKTINSLKYLELFDISWNDIHSIDEINLMPQLKILNLQGNPNLKRIPQILSTCDNLQDLILDPENIEWPPFEVTRNGTSFIMKYLSTGEKDYSALVQEAAATKDSNSREKIDAAEDALMCVELQNEEQYTQKDKNRKYVPSVPYDYGNENELLKQLQLKQDQHKQEILKEILEKQYETESLVNKIQQQKDDDRSKLINDLLEAERKAAIIIDNLFTPRLNPDPMLLRKEEIEQQHLFEEWQLQHSELRKQEILSTMMEILRQEELKVQDYQEKRDFALRSALQQEQDNLCELGKFFTGYEKNRAETIEKIYKDEELQKQAVAALIANNDSRTWGLIEQLKIIEAQLSFLTQLEIEKKKYSNEAQVNVLAEKRVQLTIALMELLRQKDERKNELLDTLENLERKKRNEEDFWLLQYQRLLDSRPLEFSLKTNTIDPLLGYNFLVNGVIHCLPFLQTLWKRDDFCPDKVTELDLRNAGIRDKKDRTLILKSIREYTSELNMPSTSEMSIKPSAPIPREPFKMRPTIRPGTSRDQDENEIEQFPLELSDEERSNRRDLERTESRTIAPNSIQSECVICMEETVKIIYIPCGHMCCCLNCQSKVEICPLCRAVIEKKINVIQP